MESAVLHGLAPDKGLYMPETIGRLPQGFFESIADMGFREMACVVADVMFGGDIPASELQAMVEDTLSFDCPVVNVSGSIYAQELFHGPTLAFKDVGARFMARMLGYFLVGSKRKVSVLVATSGDTGSAVANGFLGVEGIDVYVLYPKGKVSKTQESQFTTLGRNITAIEVDGVFDDCQAMVKSAFMDADLQQSMVLTSANSINVARFLPQAFYYFSAYAQMKAIGLDGALVVCVPSGNFGNITAGVVASRMGLPIKRFVAANNSNDVFLEYLSSGEYRPRHSVQTLANAMDVGAPSNFARILDLFGGSHKEIVRHISGAAFTDEEISAAIRDCKRENGYTLDPHGACGYLALEKLLEDGETGVFLETAHPAKFSDVVERATGEEVEVPLRLRAFTEGKKETVEMPADFAVFKDFLLGKASK